MSIFKVDINLDPSNFKFPMLFATKEEYLESLLKYRIHVENEYILTSTSEKTTFKYSGDWEKQQISKHKPLTKYNDLVYSVDKYGSRATKSIEILSNQDTLVSGCSNTWGHGSFYYETWPYLAYGESHVNLAINGAPTGYIIKTINAALDFYSPKQVTIFLPTLDRIEYMEFNREKKKHILYHLSAGVVRTGNKYMQKLYKDVLLNTSEHMYLMWFLTDLSLLIEKCNNRKIKLNIGSWDNDLNLILQNYTHKGFNLIEDIPKFSDYTSARDPHHKGIEYHQSLANKFKNL